MTPHLKRGEFLLLIVGAGSREERASWLVRRAPPPTPGTAHDSVPENAKMLRFRSFGPPGAVRQMVLILPQNDVVPVFESGAFVLRRKDSLSPITGPVKVSVEGRVRRSPGAPQGSPAEREGGA